MADRIDVCVVGSANMDLISYVDELPRAGETRIGDRFEIGFGGKGANQCVQATLLGARTAMLARVGDDSFGRDTIENFKRRGVSIDHVIVTPGVSTGVAPICVDRHGQNSIVVVKGANSKLCPADVEARRNELFSRSTLVVCQLETTMELVEATFRLARACGARTLFNPAPARPDISPEVLSLADIFCPNQTELEILAGLENSVEDATEAKKACEKLRVRCATAGFPLGGDIVVTLGASGALICFGGEQTGTYEHVPAEAVKAVDSTGAGDSFVGALSYFLACRPDLSLPVAVGRAVSIATRSVLSKGTQSSFVAAADLPADLLA